MICTYTVNAQGEGPSDPFTAERTMIIPLSTTHLVPGALVLIRHWPHSVLAGTVIAMIKHGSMDRYRVSVLWTP